MFNALIKRAAKRPIDDQIEAYKVWKLQQAPTMAETQMPTLYRFARLTKVEDVAEVEVRHLREFEKWIKNQCTTNYAEETALRAVRGFLRYHHARGHLCPTAEAVSKSSRELQAALT